MLRKYYISDDIDEVKSIELALEDSGISKPSIHVLSEDVSALETRNINPVSGILRKNIFHLASLGVIIGLALTALVFLSTYYFGWHQGMFGWMPAITISIFLMGFCTWEAGLIGIETPNINFAQFQNDLKQGRHVLMVDYEKTQEAKLLQTIAKYPNLVSAGDGEPSPWWTVFGHGKLRLVNICPN